MEDNFPSVLDKEINTELNKAVDYINWLSQMIEKQPKNSAIFLSLKKDIIIHFGSILECLLFYIANVGVKNGKIKLTCEEDKKEIIGKITGLPGNIAYVTKKTKNKKTELMDFKELTDQLHGRGVFGDDTKKKLDTARELRNGVHLSKKLLSAKDFEEYDIKVDYIPLFNELLVSLKAGLLKLTE